MGHDHPDMIWREAAVERVLQRRRSMLDRQPTEPLELDRIAGRTIAEPIVAERDLPAADHATMDGFAFDATDPYPLDLDGTEIFPEDEPPMLPAGYAVRIATGAPLPEGANVVLKREDAEVSGTQLSGPSLEPGTYTYRRGTNVSAGDRLFESGDPLSAKDAILIRDLGREEVSAFERFSVGILATGTEIHEDRRSDLDSRMLANLVRSWGHRATYEGTVPDEYDRVETAIEDLAADHDVVFTTGGTSVGHKDHVIRALDELGTVHFHRVRLRPGKPLAMASLDHGTAAFAIPGKPVGAHTIAALVVRPFFTAEDTLPTLTARCTTDLSMSVEGFEYVIPVTLTDGDARPLGHTSSPLAIYADTFDPSVLSSTTRATRADGFVLTKTDLRADESVEVVPYPVVE